MGISCRPNRGFTMTYSIKTKRGPKPKPAAKQQTVQVMVRLTEDEANALDDKRGKVPRGTFIRNAYLNSGSLSVPEINRDAYVELSRSASNLNQIARQLNDSGKLYIDELKEELRAFRLSLRGVADEGAE